MGTGIRLGSIAGVQVHLDWSLLVIFFLIATSLAIGVFPAWHPDWSAGLSWMVALAAAALFFASILAHELSHALVGRLRGIRIPSIRLFMFGGVAQMENEPRTWRDEFFMAIVGPVTSFVLGLAFVWMAMPSESAPVRPERMLAGLGPLQSLLLWLGQINVVLALFNMLPGFPLDGGRVLRAVIWALSGSLHRATAWASGIGRAFAWILIGSGIAMAAGIELPYFGAGFAGGLWLVFIGWFLHGAAVASYRQLLLREALEHVPVQQFMRTPFVSVPPEMPVADLVDEHLMRGEQNTYPVVSGERFEGIVSMRDVRGLQRERWTGTPVREIMTPAARVPSLHPGDDSFEALSTLERSDVNQLPIMEEQRITGMLRKQDILRWLALHGGEEFARYDRPAA